MPIRRCMPLRPCFIRGFVKVSLWLGLMAVSASLGTGGTWAQICDPNGSPPRFGCQWSLDLCEWVCPICDPYGSPPRSSCTWDGSLCNWVCNGYTGTEVTVKTQRAPKSDATVYLRMSSLCTATGVGNFCSGSFPVDPTMTTAQKCQAIVNAVAGDCSAAGYVVTVNDCLLESTLVASNLACPGTAFALGLSNDPAIFDQTQGAMPDGESEKITGTDGSCSPMPGSVGNLQVLPSAGSDILLTWDDATDAADYLVFADTSPSGTFSTVVGTAVSGATGLTISAPSGEGYFLVAGRNSSCGIGPKR